MWVIEAIGVMTLYLGNFGFEKIEIAKWKMMLYLGFFCLDSLGFSMVSAWIIGDLFCENSYAENFEVQKQGEKSNVRRSSFHSVISWITCLAFFTDGGLFFTSLFTK